MAYKIKSLKRFSEYNCAKISADSLLMIENKYIFRNALINRLRKMYFFGLIKPLVNKHKKSKQDNYKIKWLIKCLEKSDSDLIRLIGVKNGK